MLKRFVLLVFDDRGCYGYLRDWCCYVFWLGMLVFDLCWIGGVFL